MFCKVEASCNNRLIIRCAHCIWFVGLGVRVRDVSVVGLVAGMYSRTTLSRPRPEIVVFEVMRSRSWTVLEVPVPCKY